MINVLFSLHAAVLAANQKYIVYLAEEPDMKVTLLVPPRWNEQFEFRYRNILKRETVRGEK